MYYRDDTGLINSKVDEKYAENSMLWTLEYILLLRDNDELQKLGREDVRSLAEALVKCEMGHGAYAQHPKYVNNPAVNLREQYMSPDQLIVFFAALRLSKSGHSMMAGFRYASYCAWEIWEIMKLSGYFRYNNLNVYNPSNRYMHPKHVAFCALCVGHWIGWLLLPVLVISSIVSVRAPKEITSGKMLAWVHSEVLGWRWFKYILKLFLRNDSWAEVRKIYFPGDNHPVGSYGE